MNSVRYDSWRETGLKRNSQRMMFARQRRERQKKWAIGLLIAALLLILFFVFIRRTAPTPPKSFKVTWAGFNVYRELPSGSALLLSPNQSVRVVPLSDGEWKWLRGKGDTAGQAFIWRGGNVADTLQARCYGKATGLQVLAAPFWPRTNLTLNRVAVESAGGTRRRLNPQQETWLAPHVIIRRPVAWDEKALPLLNISQFGSKALLTSPNADMAGKQIASAKPMSSPPQWEIVPSFDESRPADASDSGTYVKISSSSPEADLTKAAQEMVREQPAVSLKFIIRLDLNPPTGILRIAFDGKGERKAWIRRQGEASGGPFEWDTTNPGLSPLPPSLRQPR